MVFSISGQKAIGVVIVHLGLDFGPVCRNNRLPESLDGRSGTNVFFVSFKKTWKGCFNLPIQYIKLSKSVVVLAVSAHTLVVFWYFFELPTWFLETS